MSLHKVNHEFRVTIYVGQNVKVDYHQYGIVSQLKQFTYG